MSKPSSTTPLNFAPYSEPPPIPSSSSSRFVPPAVAPTPSTSSYQNGAPVSSLGHGTSFSSHPGVGSGSGSGSGGEVDMSGLGGLGYGSALEAAFAYVLGPFGALALILWEVELDYVRFHAWQSALLSLAMLLVHLFFLIPFGKGFQKFLFFCDAILFGLLSARAYKDADLEVRYQLPVIGELAQQWVEDE